LNQTQNTAVRQNTFNAGIDVRVPIPNVRDSIIVATVMEGPTSLIAIAIFILKSLFLKFLAVLVIMNMLSTPIARIKKGTTSAEIREACMF